uniref:Not1 n=1 Tax=Panagrolaimus sp. ES5 TaxID=591445 RepID=A0AC34FIP0_9BILA
MSGLLTSKYKPHVFADYDLQQPLDRQYKNLNLNKLHENYIRSNQGDLMFAESSQKTNHEKFNVQQSFRSTNEKWIKTTLDSKASKHSFFDEHLDHSTILSTNNNPGNVNSSTLSLHIAAYENLTEDSRVEETEGGFQTKPDKKKIVTKTWKTFKQLFGTKETSGMFEIPRQQKEEVTEPEIMQFQASQQLLDPNQLSPKLPSLMAVSNTEILERSTESDGQKVELTEKKLAEEISFLCNNLTFDNLEQKVFDLRRIVAENDDTCRKWLAQYFVMKRVTLEQNHHTLYNSLLYSVYDDKLNEYVRLETLRNIKILLDSEKKLDAASWSFDERQLLKNLGQWLGMITLARNEPIFMLELDIRGLLEDALSKGEKDLFYVVPFVVKILESSAFSSLFSPACYWIRQLLYTLGQIYQQPNIKLAVKFEFEVLCQKLKVGLGCILPPYSYLPHENQHSIQPPGIFVGFVPHFAYNEIDIYKPLDLYLDIPMDLPLFHLFTGLSNLCRHCISQAITENIEELTRRASTCSIKLTSELITKDFAQCADFYQFRRSYLYMVRSLTCATGLITAKEPLTTSIIGRLRALVQQHIDYAGPPDKELVQMADETMIHILEKNIDLVVCYVSKSASERAMYEIDKLMEDQVQRRKIGMDLKLSPEIQAIVDKIPKVLRPIGGVFNNDTLSTYNLFGGNIIGFKITGLDDPVVTVPPEPGQQYYEIDQQLHYPSVNPELFRIQTETVFHEWCCYCFENGVYPFQADGTKFFNLMEKYGVLVNEGTVMRFLKISLDICNDVAYELLSKKDRSLTNMTRSSNTVDAFSQIICFFVKSGDTNERKMQMLSHALEMITSTLISDHEVKHKNFTGFPMLRVFITMIREFCNINFGLFQSSEHRNLVESFGRALNVIQPRRVPAFAYHWLEILGHRLFLTYFLSKPYATDITRAVYTHLIVELIKFLAPFFRNVCLPKAINHYYTATLRLMVLILHDFPELLCDYYYVFCDVIPPNCIQLRNLVLSAFPPNMKLPDPYKQKFETVEESREMNTVSKISSKMFTNIPEEFRSALDEYLENPSNVSCLPQLIRILKSDEDTAGNKYNAPVVNSLVNYIGIRAISKIKEHGKCISKTTVAESSYMKIFQPLIITLDNEGRYLLFNALANQLRYPNAQTHYFACTILYLFKEAANDAIREQIARLTFLSKFVI